ncbi:hypothetical protein K1719_015288 [Acacia pycnantha]|nr:hypothetical protein K1719_015288 [Acacia pycnantha]
MNTDAELKPGEPVLDWPTRKRVALGTARGLEYLHEHCNPKIIHRDVKAANIKKLEREKRLDAIVDCNLNKNYNTQEVEMMIKVALLCTQASPEDRPAMSEVVRMLEGEGLAERWEEWQHVEVTRRQEYERLQRRFDWGEDSVHNQDAIELSGGDEL